MRTLESHEAANIFPLDDDAIDAMAADIKANGQKVPIELLGGKIIDGRQRYQACRRAEVEPKCREVSVDDPVGYVLSLNLHRRHLTASQKAMVAARSRELFDRMAKERQKESGKVHGRGKVPVNVPEPIKGDARDQAGKAVGVSGSLVDRGTKVIEKGEPELVQAVDEGRMSVSTAAQLADEPAAVQKAVAREAKFSGGRYRKPEVLIEEDADAEKIARKGVGVMRAHEAINCLSRIPKNDALRKRGFQLVTDWIKRNKGA